MTLKAFLDLQRTDYIKGLEITFSKLSPSDREPFLECLDIKANPQNVKEIFSYFRYDILCKGLDGYFYEIKVNVNPLLEKKVFNEKGIQLIIDSFVWNACEFSFTNESFKPDSLSTWFEAWIKPGLNELMKKKQEVIHSISFEKNLEVTQIVLDFGTVSTEAVIELLDLLAVQKINKIFVRSLYL